MKTKVCPKCGKRKNVSRFSKCSKAKDKLQGWCKECLAKYQQEYRQTKEGKTADQKGQKKYRATPKGKAAHQKGCRKYSKSKKGKIVGRKSQKKYRESGKGKRTIKNRLSTLRGHLRRIFTGINTRCNNPKCKDYKNYMGRGIKNKFTFDKFYQYITTVLGITKLSQIKGLEIDRIDNDGHYEPGNIRFVTTKINANNRRNSKR